MTAGQMIFVSMAVEHPVYPGQSVLPGNNAKTWIDYDSLMRARYEDGVAIRILAVLMAKQNGYGANLPVDQLIRAYF